MYVFNIVFFVWIMNLILRTKDQQEEIDDDDEYELISDKDFN